MTEAERKRKLLVRSCQPIDVIPARDMKGWDFNTGESAFIQVIERGFSICRSSMMGNAGYRTYPTMKALMEDFQVDNPRAEAFV